ncbi:MAG: AraC family transcriptional regulator [Hydrocarboniphaga sp.]|uniref:AraC family transcriptional regulator n=1 Tax=Hydrocarboniphaga sp. TaxID=2033016 RepID=UPI002618EE24|nr:AraC family transcriptional regulator [Hydrocarboniphaga sp.]MDB5972202.1 AraC family transcriptional regulator [Hydrocarboniphaga sp.]
MGETAFFSLEGPLDSMPAEGQMRTANLGGFADLVRGLGADPRPILERHGLDARAIRDPDSYISCKSLVSLLEDCSTRFNQPLFGLRLAQLQEPDLFGSVTALCRAASTFREAIVGFIDYLPVVHSPVILMELVEGKETAELRWCVRSDLGSNNQANYQAALLDVNFLRLIGGRNFRPSYVNLAVDTRLKDIAELENQLGCRFNARATTNAIAFPVENLSQAVTTSNRLLFRLLGGYLDRVKVASRKTVVERVEDYVRGSLPSGNCSIEHCAKKLGTSVRTLQANLSDCGLKFSDLLEKQRIEMAKIYLERGQLSLDDVAASLGYSEQSSFGRAFKRWTGDTPQQYRRGLVAAGVH